MPRCLNKSSWRRLQARLQSSSRLSLRGGMLYMILNGVENLTGEEIGTSLALTDELWRICRLFQALLVLSVVDEKRYGRSFRSFNLASFPSMIAIEFDASLFCGGGLLFTILNGVETLIGGFKIDLLPLEFGCDAQYQNCAEFITAVVGLKIARQFGLNTSSLLLRGDSTTALHWAESTHFRGTRVTQAACVFIFETTIYGVDNVKNDALAKRIQHAL